MFPAAIFAWGMVDFSFEMVISASCFAQLKRHRMATLLPQSYDPSLGYTIPESIQNDKASLEGFERIMERSETVHKQLCVVNPHVAPYALTNAHRRRVLFKCNLRELYAFSRLRQDCHAQWEIRDIANKIVDEIHSVAPLATMLLAGKDTFEQLKKMALDPEGFVNESQSR